MVQKNLTHTVMHKRLYMSVDGRLCHIQKGSQLTLSSKQAEKLGDRVSKIDSQKVELSKDEDSKDKVSEG